MSQKGVRIEIEPGRTSGAGPRPRKEGSRPARCIRSLLDKKLIKDLKKKLQFWLKWGEKLKFDKDVAPTCSCPFDSIVFLLKILYFLEAGRSVC